MARYIDADALKKEINDLSPQPNCEWSGWGVLAAIDRQETADVRPKGTGSGWSAVNAMNAQSAAEAQT